MALHRQVEIGFEVEPVAIDDALGEPVFELFRPALLLRLLDRAVLEQRDERLQRVVAVAAAVEDQILGDPHLVLGDAVERQDLARNARSRRSGRGAARGRETPSSAPAAPAG